MEKLENTSQGKRRENIRGICLYLSAGYPSYCSGECITEQLLEVILDYIRKGLPVQGLRINRWRQYGLYRTGLILY